MIKYLPTRNGQPRQLAASQLCEYESDRVQIVNPKAEYIDTEEILGILGLYLPFCPTVKHEVEVSDLPWE